MASENQFLPIELDWFARELEDARGVDSNGNPTFTNLPIEELAMMLAASMYASSKDLNEEEKQDICSDAMFSVADKKGPITGPRLKASIERLKQEFLKKPEKRYVLVTSLTLPKATRVQRMAIDGMTLEFADSFPRFDRSFVENLDGGDKLPDDAKYLKAKVHVSGRSLTGAQERALDVLDFVRGAWNLSINRRIARAWSFDPTKAVNQVLLGPYHTVHFSNGQPADDSYWYEPFFQIPTSVSIRDQLLLGMQRDFVLIRRQCARSSIGMELKQALIRYCRALDVRDSELAFLKLWGVLEVLTGTVGGRYDDTIKRTCFLYKESTFERNMMEVLRKYRNRSVHQGTSSISRETVVILNRYVARLFEFALTTGDEFRSLNELTQFLALPVDEDALTRRLYLYRKAVKYRGITESAKY